MYPSSANLRKINQLSNQSFGMHKPAVSWHDPNQPAPLLHYSPRDRMQFQYRAPEHSLTSDAQLSSLTPPFPTAQSSEPHIKPPFTGPNIPEVRIT